MQRILVVDDEDGIRDILRQYLEFEGFACVEAADGEAAVSMMKNDPVDLILMDIMMPVCDGITALRRIREFSDVPVILLTAKGEEYDKVFGFDLGADDYVVKPFSPREVMSRVKAVLKRTSRTETGGRLRLPFPHAGSEPKILCSAHRRPKSGHDAQGI